MKVLAPIFTLPFFFTLRHRLLSWFLIFFFFIISSIFIIFSFFYYFSFKNQVDHHLQIVFSEAQQIIKNYHAYQRNSLLTNLVGAEAMTIVLLSSDGTTILQTNSPDVALVSEHQLQQSISRQNQSGNESHPNFFSVGNTRFITAKYVGPDDEGFIAVGYSMDFFIATFNNYLLIMLGLVILFFVVFGYATYRFLDHNLSSLEEIAQFAKTITHTSDLSRNNQVPISTISELKIIGLALEKMMKEMNQIFIHERDFFSDTAHIIKTPLAGLKSEVELLNISDKKKNYFHKTINQIVFLVNDLLYLSKIQTTTIPERETMNVSSMMTDFKELLAGLAQQKNIVITIEVQNDIEIQANKNAFSKAIGNIVMNAVEYTPPNGLVLLKLTKEEQIIKIKIANTGSYIPDEEKEKIFERFYRLNNKKKDNGFGLGLATSKTIIDKMGGSIIVQSKKSIGTIFTITLPCKISS